ncbi:MAG: tRNA epoxyqueuosine(34) reductase QueG [Magnetococcales bacterium]|nr:tRNA epoxyqueuosine(34) reductase QueG [Magnetococcales bacterium]
MKEIIRQLAYEAGFDCVGFAAPAAPHHSDRLPFWLAERRHGDMNWLERSAAKRLQPSRYRADVGTILVLGHHYRPQPAGPMASPMSDQIAAYACRSDYHDQLRHKMQLLADRIISVVGDSGSIRSCVDSAPLMEKPLAVAAGIGWQGKNSLLVSRQFGCWLLLCELLLPWSLPADQPLPQSHCGSCQRCQRACPTAALDQAYWIDASRCLAYLTIEYKGTLPRPYRSAMGTRIYGCDSCLSVCPWNRFTPTPRHDPTAQQLQTTWQSLTLPACAALNEDGFRALFQQTPLARIGLTRLLRNVAVALGNWGQPEAIPALIHLLHHHEPLVRSHAVWGLAQYAPHSQSTQQALQQATLDETSPEVRAELALI